MRSSLYVEAALVAVIGLGACSPQPIYRQTDISSATASTEPLNPSKGILVSVPKDAAYQHDSYPGSGQEVAQRTASAFTKYARHVEIAIPALREQPELLLAARNAGAGYLLVPTIVHWEQRATGWSGIPSQVDVSLTVIDVETEREIRSTVLEGRSDTRNMQQKNIEEMYSGVLKEHAARLYGVEIPEAKQHPNPPD
jgi:hypothetical protein